jgi:hypothetical protein
VTLFPSVHLFLGLPILLFPFGLHCRIPGVTESTESIQPDIGLVRWRTCILMACRHAALYGIPKREGYLFHLRHQTAPLRSSSLNCSTRALHIYIWKEGGPVNNVLHYAGWMFSAFEYFVTQSCTTAVIHLLENISFYFILQQVFFLHSFLPLFFFPFILCLFHTFISEWLYSITMFLQTLYTIKPATCS